MALKATVFRAQLSIADMDRHHYANYSLTLARHPSEHDLRMMVRLLAFALNASDTLQFSRGLCVDDEPALWQKSLQGDIELWIDLGQHDEKRLRRACAMAQRVNVYTYQSRSATPWWQQMEGKLSQLEKLRVYHLEDDSAEQLTTLVARHMQLQCTIQEGTVWLSDGDTCLTLQPQRWQ